MNPSRLKTDYRPCVGIALFNQKGELWVGRRAGVSGDYVWQCPQGGIDPGETPRFAGLRELFEETGIGVHLIKPLGKVDGWLYYDFPKGYKQKNGQSWRGQRQRWYAYRYTGSHKEFRFDLHGTPEFTDFKWINLETAPDLIIPFKRNVYERLASEFAPFARA